MATKPKYHPSTRFRVEKPSSTVVVFRIRQCSPDTAGKWRAVKHPDIAIANKLYRDGTATAEHTYEKLKIILKALYAARDKTKKKPAFMAGNLAIVERLWAEKYTPRRRRQMKRPEQSFKDMHRAVEAAGLHPLDTCDLDELADYLDASLHDNPRRHARRITWINSILKYLGRETIPPLDINERRKVKYINEAEFALLLPTLPNEHTRNLATIAFYTGLRIGEIFGLQSSNVQASHLVVEGQMTDVWQGTGYKIDTTKTKAERDALLPGRALAAVKAWVAVPRPEREAIRECRWSSIIRRACERLWPADNNKHLTFHALRHCNAIWLLQKGATLTEVAQHLGNHAEVTERYYSGFQLKKESVERLRKLIGD